MIVATGSEAGGHRPAFLRPAEESIIGTMALIPQVRDAVRIPVIAAGGIADARGIKAALALGADAVQIGTAFLRCRESGTSQAHRDSIPQQASERSRLTRAMTGRLARVIQNELMDKLEAAGSKLPFPWQGTLNAPFKAQALATGDLAHFPGYYSGQGGPLCQHESAAELLAALVAGME
jgi:nitronate monooxygenase